MSCYKKIYNLRILKSPSSGEHTYLLVVAQGLGQIFWYSKIQIRVFCTHVYCELRCHQLVSHYFVVRNVPNHDLNYCVTSCCTQIESLESTHQDNLLCCLYQPNNSGTSSTFKTRKILGVSMSCMWLSKSEKHHLVENKFCLHLVSLTPIWFDFSSNYQRVISKITQVGISL